MISPLDRSLELSGLVHGSGILGRPSTLVAGGQVPASIEIEEGKLIWCWFGPGDKEPTLGIEVAGTLDAFLRIDGELALLRFARRFGVLEICEHGVPLTHSVPAAPWATPRNQVACEPREFEPPYYWEPLESWMRYVAQARALLEIAAALTQGKSPQPETWAAVGVDPANWPEQTLEGQRLQLGHEVQCWLELGGVRPSFTWGSIQPTFQLTGSTFGTIAAQLMLAVAQSHGVAICNACGAPYLPTRLPQKGRRNFCSACGGRGASRLRQRDLVMRRQKSGPMFRS